MGVDLVGASYRVPAGTYDEMLGTGRSPLPHWREFMESLAALSPDELERRWDMGQELLKENGVTYNVYGDPQGLDRPWRMDPLPMMISAEEWKQISNGVTQRARLMDAILGDLYGPQSLLAEGWLPPAIIHANPAYLRPCHGWVPAGGSWLHHYAVDLARGPDGRWWVVSDRCESPAGAGYALENRIIAARLLPEFFRSIPVERLAPFFDTLSDTLHALSPRRVEAPRIVLMTPGPYNETYFEHAYLARQLGITLVQGEDLTVRDNHVYLKTLTGLQPVDVIMRRTNGIWCDPLDLRGDSQLGVAGLVQAARAGNVTIFNALGSGLLEGAAIMPFLPTLAGRLLGEELKLPSLATWWCGQPRERKHVLENMDRLVLRPAFHNRRRSVLGETLSADERAQLAAEIETHPWDWVAQELGAMSTAPVWMEGHLEPQHTVLRVFATVAPDGTWHMMHGGLARVSPARDLLTSTLQGNGSGGGSKDAWVLAEAELDLLPPPRGAPVVTRLSRGTRDLPSRVADNMFWLGRYVERCECTTRMLRLAMERVENALDQGERREALSIARTMVRLGLPLPPIPAKAKAADELPDAIAHLHFGGGPLGLKADAERLQRTVAHLRDRLSIDTWRALQKLNDEVAKLRPPPARTNTLSRLNNVILTVEAFSGLAMENMTRGPLWYFMDTGRRLERAIHACDLLAGAVSGIDSPDQVPLDLLLDVSDSTMTYRARYLASAQFAPVLDLLMCDESNPRSLGFQLAALEEHAQRLGGPNDLGFPRPEQRLMTVLCGTVRTVDAAILVQPDEDGGYHDLERLLESLRSQLWKLSETVTREYFTHAQWHLPTRRLGRIA